MRRLCCADSSGLGWRRLVPGFRKSILLDMPPSTTPGSSVPRYSSLAAPTWPLPTRTEARLSQVTCDPLPAGEVLRGFLVRFCCGLSSCSPPVRIWPEISQPSGLLLPGFRRVGHPSRRWI